MRGPGGLRVGDARTRSRDLSNEQRLVLGQRCGEIEAETAEHMANWEQWSQEIEEGLATD